MDNYDLQVDIGRRIFLQYDQKRLIEKFRLKAEDQWLYLTYLNTLYRINRETGGIEQCSENIWKECREYSTVMTIYDLLCYNKEETVPKMCGQWCAVGSFIVAGITKTEPFTEQYAKCFDGHMEALKTACEKLGGILQKPMAGADLTYLFPVTEFFPVLLQFWEGDEEFPPKLMILWDRNTDQFLHFETTFYLQGDLLRQLKNLL